jgi:hypothetical protein
VIVLWGLGSERPLAAVHAALRRRGCAVTLLDQRDTLETRIELVVDSRLETAVHVANASIELSEATAAYLRPYDSRRLPRVAAAGCASSEWWHAMSVEDLLLSWADVTPARVVNRPEAMAANNAKPYQASRISTSGFRVPETIVTTDPEAVRAFWAVHGTVIYKSTSGVRSVVARLTAADTDRIDDVRWCPTQFQAYVVGEDVRVHVIGDEIYACTVTSSADDYRYANGAVQIRSCRLPDAIASRCHALARSMDLLVAGIDLRRAPNDDWYCFEVNPSPGFSYYQDATDQPLDEAIASLLAA